jgi:hypothetical protein
MSRPANPYDNASCESFMKTLKREVIHAHPYRDLEHLLENVAAFIDNYYTGCGSIQRSVIGRRRSLNKSRALGATPRPRVAVF